MIRIDGSLGEGGGQVIRTSLSLAAITGRSFEVTNVRAGRSKPGIQPQHLASVRAAASLCGADVEGDSIGSPRFSFRPQSQAKPGDFRFDVGTAGSVSLVAQTVLAPLWATDGRSSVQIVGGTHVPHSPPVDYMEAVYLATLEPLGLGCGAGYSRAGFFPKGGGELALDVYAAPARTPLALVTRGRLVKLRAFVVTAELPGHVAERGAAAVAQCLKRVGREAEIEIRERSSLSPGAAVILAAECENGRAGFTSLGERGKPMERVAEDACNQFMAWWKTGTAVDEHLADQLALPMSLVAGESSWSTPRITEHLRTVLQVVEQFLPIRHTLVQGSDGSGIVRLHGAPPGGC